MRESASDGDAVRRGEIGVDPTTKAGRALLDELWRRTKLSERGLRRWDLEVEAIEHEAAQQERERILAALDIPFIGTPVLDLYDAVMRQRLLIILAEPSDD